MLVSNKTAATSITPSVEGNHINDFKADSLPPFSVLTSDEDREKKAEYRAPGTYNIVVNPSSFTNMEEYRGSSNEPTPKLKLARANSLQRQQSMSSITGLGSSGDPQDDPDVVILAYFEADTMSMSVSNNHNTHSTISIASSPSISSSTSYTSHTDVATFLNEAMPAQNFVQIPYRNGEDDQLIAHFNKFVQRSFAQVHRDALGTTSDTHTLLAHDVFAGEAAHFPPVCIIFPSLQLVLCPFQNIDTLQASDVADVSIHIAFSRSDGAYGAQHGQPGRRTKCRCSTALPKSISISSKQCEDYRGSLF